jgi:hypothetical protein
MNVKGSLITKNVNKTFDKLVGNTQTIVMNAWKRRLKKAYIDYQKSRFQTKNWGVWSELSETTIRKKEKGQFPWSATQPLVSSGKLFRSMTGSVKDGYREVVTENSIMVSDVLSTNDYPANYGMPVYQRMIGPIRPRKQGKAYNIAWLQSDGTKRGIPPRKLNDYTPNFMEEMRKAIKAAIHGR